MKTTSLGTTRTSHRLAWSLPLLALARVVLLLASLAATPLFGATLATDRPDYAPGSFVTFTGTG